MFWDWVSTIVGFFAIVTAVLFFIDGKIVLQEIDTTISRPMAYWVARVTLVTGLALLALGIYRLDLTRPLWEMP